jgi:catechol 2,3-dioxygenase-like lactoylglutathione lyase family enzyme
MATSVATMTGNTTGHQLERKSLQPISLNHYATATLDMEVTHKFWTEIMGCKFGGAVRQDGEGLPELKTGSFLHCFYSFQDNASVAFFEVAGGYDPKPDGIPGFTKHLALNVNSREELVAWQKHLTDHDISVAGEIDHDGLFYSIYLTDPNGLMVELTYQTRPLNNEDIEEGYEVMKNWSADKISGLV